MSHAYRMKIRPHLDVFAKGLTLIVTAAFEEARTPLLMYGKAGSSPARLLCGVWRLQG
jgi:hypothetical protein